MDLKAKLETKEKKIMGLTTENASLKAQNVLLDKRTKELNEICQKQEKELIEVKKEKQNLTILQPYNLTIRMFHTIP